MCSVLFDDRVETAISVCLDIRCGTCDTSFFIFPHMFCEKRSLSILVHEDININRSTDNNSNIRM